MYKDIEGYLFGKLKKGEISKAESIASTLILKTELLNKIDVKSDYSVSGSFVNIFCKLEDLNMDLDEIEAEEDYIEDFQRPLSLKNSISHYICEGTFCNDCNCVFKTCPYAIAIDGLFHTNQLNIKKSGTSTGKTIPAKKTVPSPKSSTISKSSASSEILNRISKIKQEELKKDLISILEITSVFENATQNINGLIPSVYFVAGENTTLKNNVSNLISDTIKLADKSLKSSELDLLEAGNIEMCEDSITIFSNLEKDTTNNSLEKELIKKIYSSENNNKFAIINTKRTNAFDISAKISSNSNIKCMILNVDNYSDEELINIFYEKSGKLGLKFDLSFSKAISNGYMKSFMEDNSNLKNEAVVNKLIANLCSNLSENGETLAVTLNETYLPDIKDKTGECKTVQDKLDSLTGLQSVKEQLNNLMSYLTFLKKMDGKMDIPILNLHSIFSGSPGTGKTTVARIYADMLFELGYIKENKLIEVAKEDLVAEYVGHTAPKTKKVFEKAMGGVLFIDEAYSLTPTEGKGFESECIATMIKMMEDYRDNIVVIFAGYEQDMQKFLDANEGLRSRVTNNVIFEDYSSEELYEIFSKQIEKTKLKLDPSVKPKVIDIFEKEKLKKSFGNGRFICNFVQKTLMKHSINTFSETDEDVLVLISEKDII